MARIGNITLRNSLFVTSSLFFLFLGTNQLFSGLTKKRQLLFFFDKIEINGAVDVFVKPGARDNEAYIFADTSVIDAIGLHVRERTLFVDANNTFDISRRLPFLKISAERTFPIELIVHKEKLSEIRLNGRSNLVLSELNSPKVFVNTSGSGRFHLENSTINNLSIRQDGTGPIILKGEKINSLELKVLNNGPILAQSLPADHVQVTHHGNGDIEINPLKFLDTRIMAEGNIILHQRPTNLVVTQKGGGRVLDISPDSPTLYEINASQPTLSVGQN